MSYKAGQNKTWQTVPPLKTCPPMRSVQGNMHAHIAESAQHLLSLIQGTLSAMHIYLLQICDKVQLLVMALNHVAES